MLGAANEVFSVLVLLLPGFVVAVIYYSLTSNPKPSPFERVIQALVFTAIIQVIAAVLPKWFPSHEVDIGAEALWDPVRPAAVAVFLAFVVVVVVNNDLVHGLLRKPSVRKLRVTKQTSHPTEWYSAFARYDQHYVVLHLKRKRRLYGWPTEWTDDPAQGHLRITEGEWLTDDGSEPLDNVDGVLIPVGDVEMVEFIQAKIDESEGRDVSRWLRNLLSRLAALESRRPHHRRRQPDSTEGELG